MARTTWTRWTWRSSSSSSPPSPQPRCPSPRAAWCCGASHPAPACFRRTCWSSRSAGWDTGGAVRQPHAHGPLPAQTRSAWTTVPMPPGLAMLPAEMALRPAVAPFLPTGPAPPARRARSSVSPRRHASARGGLGPAPDQGRSYTMFAFNGQYPGPADRGGARLRGHGDFSNRLPQPTTVHWHGIRLEHRNDGVPGALPAGGAAGRAHSPTGCAFPTPGSTGITRMSGRTCSRSSGSTATCWSARARERSTGRPTARRC